MKKQDDDASFAAVNEIAHKSGSEKTLSISSVAHQLDDLGLVAPTEEEMNTLRHVPDKINWAAYSEPSLVFRVMTLGLSLKPLRSDCLRRTGRTFLRKSYIFIPFFNV
jgi:hypothetical protein